MRVLMITTEYPTPEHPGRGIFIRRQVEALQKLGVQVDVLAFNSRANPLNYLKAWLAMHRKMRGKAYDLIHAQFGHSGLVARAQLKLPVVITFRGDDLQGIVGNDGRYTLKGSVFVALSRVVSRFAQQVIVVAEKMGQRLPRRDYTVIPSGLDLDLFQPIPYTEARAILGWQLNKRVVLFVAFNNDPRKRYGLASATVDLAREQLESEVELMTVSNVPPAQMPLYMNASDTLLLTSMHEGSPNVVKEALACNLPVVSVDIGDVAERLSGVTPSAVCVAEPTALAEALIAILRNPVRSNGRQAVMKLAEPLLAQQVLEVYHKLSGLDKKQVSGAI